MRVGWESHGTGESCWSPKKRFATNDPESFAHSTCGCAPLRPVRRTIRAKSIAGGPEPVDSLRLLSPLNSFSLPLPSFTSVQFQTVISLYL